MVQQPPDLKISQFEGPLDLLFHLIEKNQIDIYDIPIAEITDQYLEYLDGLARLDMESASSFLLMASTLLQIKSRMLLPQKRLADAEEGHDPREELVLRLLEYRRCRTLADQLRERHQIWQRCQLRLPEAPQRLGITRTPVQDSLSWDRFWLACQQVARQNHLRFQDVSQRISHILKREKVSLKDKMKQIWHQIRHRSRLFFNELFPADTASRAERVTGFLAVLELLRLNRIQATQEHPFDVILLEVNETASESGPLPDVSTLIEEKAYE